MASLRAGRPGLGLSEYGEVSSCRSLEEEEAASVSGRAVDGVEEEQRQRQQQHPRGGPLSWLRRLGGAIGSAARAVAGKLAPQVGGEG